MKPKVLLIVEDNDMVLRSLIRRFRQALPDWHVYGADDPRIVVEVTAISGKVDVVLTDYQLESQYDGLDVIEAFHRNSPETVRILMSADLDRATRDPRFPFGVEVSYEKPFDVAEVLRYLAGRGFNVG